MKTTILRIAIFSAIVLGILACNKDINNYHDSPQLPEVAYDYMQIMAQTDDFKLPSAFDVNMFDPTNSFFPEGININNIIGSIENRPNIDIVNNDVATLGRVLFYDKKLSKNNSISCASCHKQHKAFADGTALSEGFGGKKTTRNSMSLVNPIMNNSFFWDSRQHSLKQLTFEPITNHIEMGIEDMQTLVYKLENVDYYANLFENAYGDNNVTPEKIAEAMSQFVASIFTRDSKFDEVIENSSAGLSGLEMHGMALFFSDRTNCSGCHSGLNFSAPDVPGGAYQQSEGTANIGLEVEYADNGKGSGKFKIPSLRNIALTGPYMHDGRFNTLREVLEHYNEDVNPHTHLDSKLKENGTPIKMNLTELDLDALEAFLVTLTSKSITTNPMYGNPFQY